YCNYDLFTVICTVFNHEIIYPKDTYDFKSPILVKKYNLATKKAVLRTGTPHPETLLFPG
ncbi:MAG: hypothetical protein ACUZ8I_12450, partial [Candidatus Scalindua sp.]